MIPRIVTIQNGNVIVGLGLLELTCTFYIDLKNMCYIYMLLLQASAHTDITEVANIAAYM